MLVAPAFVAMVPAEPAGRAIDDGHGVDPPETQHHVAVFHRKTGIGMGEFIAVAGRAERVFLYLFLMEMPLPDHLAVRRNFVQIVAIDIAVMLGAFPAADHAPRCVRRHDFPADMQIVAVGQLARIVMLLAVDVFVQQRAVPVIFADRAAGAAAQHRADAAFEARMGFSGKEGIIVHMRCRQQPPAGQHIDQIARLIGQVPFMNDLARHIDQIGGVSPQPRNQGKARCRTVRIMRRETDLLVAHSCLACPDRRLVRLFPGKFSCPKSLYRLLRRGECRSRACPCVPLA